MAAPDPRSGMLRAGTILVAIGTGLRVLALVVALFALLGILGAGALELGLVVLVVSVGAVGAAFGYLGWKKVQEGNFRGGALMAMVAAFVPPVDLFFLIGSILVYQSDEAKAETSPLETPMGNGAP